MTHRYDLINVRYNDSQSSQLDPQPSIRDSPPTSPRVSWEISRVMKASNTSVGVPHIVSPCADFNVTGL